MTTDYKDKIKKLLALAQSPNELEARAALLKARQLMAKHKLTEAECIDSGKLKVRRETIGMTCSKRRDSWMIGLSAIIANNYCCTAYLTRNSGKQTVTIGFVGFEDDFEICELVFRYAVDCVHSRQRGFKRKYSKLFSAQYVRKICDGYGIGFMNGVSEAFEQQSGENQEWGLVMATPKEVLEASNDMKPGKAFTKSPDWDAIGETERWAICSGYKDGKDFDPNHRLSETI